jgi:hypothetical protein
LLGFPLKTVSIRLFFLDSGTLISLIPDAVAMAAMTRGDVMAIDQKRLGPRGYVPHLEPT